jgi:hypothetical protein
MKLSTSVAAAVALLAVTVWVVVIAPTAVPTQIASDSLLLSILSEYEADIGADLNAYRNHCLRVYNLAVIISQRREPLHESPAARRNEIFQIATAFHDIGLWTDDTVAYLEPSEKRAAAWLMAHGRAEDVELVTAMIEEHHKVTSYTGPPLVKDFMQADWNDVLLGALALGGVSRGEIKGLQARFPNAGFHARLAAFGLEQMRRDPLHPLPMFKW